MATFEELEEEYNNIIDDDDKPLIIKNKVVFNEPVSKRDNKPVKKYVRKYNFEIHLFKT
jgi:hypothetical protein